MTYKIDLPVIMRAGRVIYQPGIYRVPQDLNEELAARAVRDHGATRMGAPDRVFPQRRWKRGAPENKVVGDADTKEME